MSELGKLLEIPWLPLGTLINALAILAFGLAGLWLSKQIPDQTQQRLRKVLAGLTFVVGGWMIANGIMDGWKGTENFWQFLGLGGIALLAISFGNLLGTWLKLQERLDRLGKAAKDRFAKLQNDESTTFSDGFVTCTILFTVGPLSSRGTPPQRSEYTRGWDGSSNTQAPRSGLQRKACFALRCVISTVLMDSANTS